MELWTRVSVSFVVLWRATQGVKLNRHPVRDHWLAWNLNTDWLGSILGPLRYLGKMNLRMVWSFWGRPDYIWGVWGKADIHPRGLGETWGETRRTSEGFGESRRTSEGFWGNPTYIRGVWGRADYIGGVLGRADYIGGVLGQSRLHRRGFGAEPTTSEGFWGRADYIGGVLAKVGNEKYFFCTLLHFKVAGYVILIHFFAS